MKTRPSSSKYVSNRIIAFSDTDRSGCPSNLSIASGSYTLYARSLIENLSDFVRISSSKLKIAVTPSNKLINNGFSLLLEILMEKAFNN